MIPNTVWNVLFLLTWCHVAVLALAWVIVLAGQPRKLVIAHWVSMMGHMVPITGGGLLVLMLVAALGLPAAWAAPLALVPFALIAALRFELSLLGGLGRPVQEMTALLTIVMATLVGILGWS